MALEAGFRKFDTAEADWWYDQSAVGRSLHDYFAEDKTCVATTDKGSCQEKEKSCIAENLRISTKIPPWSFTSYEDIRAHARNSRDELLGFCQDEILYDDRGNALGTYPFPLDVYYIHAPQCWRGWHPSCDNPPPTLNLYDTWKAMEAVVGIDRSAKRIGLSNVHPAEFRSLIHWVKQRELQGETNPSPRLPDVLQAYADPIQPTEELRQICDEHGIEFVSYSTLGTQHRNSNGNPVLGSPLIQGLAAKHGRSVAEVVLSWALQNNMSVIPRSSKKTHIQELARLLEDEPTFLDEGDLTMIDSMKYSST